MSAVPVPMTLEQRYERALQDIAMLVRALQVIKRGEIVGRKMARPELRSYAATVLATISAPKRTTCPL
jgi:hypothetical protein